MKLLQRIADRLILVPSTDEIDPEGKRQLILDLPDGQLEVWAGNTGVQSNASSADLIAIKFPGAAGRAERSTIHPFGFNANSNVEVWTVNHCGYGGSSPPASLANFQQSIDVVWAAAREQWPDRKIVVCGNSLGSISALNMAARFPVSGIFLRNPVPLKELISSRPRYAWPSLGLSRFVAYQLPEELDSVSNAAQCNCPMLFVRSEKDRVIPERFQQMIWTAFHGVKKEFIIPDADHHHRIPESKENQYLESLNWLFGQIA